MDSRIYAGGEAATWHAGSATKTFRSSLRGGAGGGSGEHDDDWPRVKPLLDEAMDALKEADRAAILLRYFENQSLREVGSALGLSDDAAQKRVNRAMDRLRRFFVGRGVAVGAGALAVVLSAHAIEAAPTGLAAAATGSALSELGCGRPLAAATPTALNAITLMTKSTKAIFLGVALLGCGGAALWVIARTRGRPSDPRHQSANLSQYVGRFEMTGHTIVIHAKGKPGVKH